MQGKDPDEIAEGVQAAFARGELPKRESLRISETRFVQLRHFEFVVERLKNLAIACPMSGANKDVLHILWAAAQSSDEIQVVNNVA